MSAANPSSSRYASALFELAAQNNQQQAVSSAVVSLAAALEDASVKASLANPRLTPAQRKSLAGVMAKAVKAPTMLANTLGVLAANNRLDQLAQVLAAYRELADAASGITLVKLASAEPLTDAQRTRLTDLLKKHTATAGIRLEETLDPTLKGGFRAFWNGKVWDASLSGAVARLSASLKQAVTQR